MKLYFYSVNTDKRYGKLGIALHICEAEEKPKTYCSVDGYFPGYVSRIRKDIIGEINNRRIVLTHPDFAYAKNEFKELAEFKVANAKERLKSEEEELKLIEESEE